MTKVTKQEFKECFKRAYVRLLKEQMTKKKASKQRK